MNAMLKLVQGTEEWHQHRARYRNASETPAVMGLSPWQTPYELWLLKTGRKEAVENEAMRYGTAMEPAARRAYEEATGNIMQPKVMVNGLYSASLDGISLDGGRLLEIKCPYRGNTSELWQTVRAGQAPEHYRLQVQHQLMVSQANLAELWVFDGRQGIKVEVDPDPLAFERIKEAWDGFQHHLDTDTPPPLTEQDTVLREDAEWREAADAYIGWKGTVEEAQAKADEAKARLIALASHSRESGSGVVVTRYWKQGSIDYKKVPEIQGVDLEAYRGKSREEVRVTISKEGA